MGTYFHTIFIFCLFANFIYAEPSLTSDWPPTAMETLRSYKGKLPKLGTYSGSGHFDVTMLPNAIAALERAFPGAIWAPLGRDATVMGDALNAYYGIIKQQENRVVPLKASTASFPENKANPSLIKFLKSAGANFNPKDKKAKPFIILDRTSFGETSQSTSLLKAAYSEWKNNKGKAEDFLYRFNVINVSGATPSQVDAMDATLDTREHLQTQSDLLKKKGKIEQITIFSVEGYSDGNAWNDSYGRFKTHSDGFYGTKGAANHIQYREEAIGEQLDFLWAVKEPGFQKKVVKAAKILGFNISTPNPKTAYIELSAKEKLRRNIKALKDFANGQIEYPDNDVALEQFMKHRGLFEKLTKGQSKVYKAVLNALAENKAEYREYVLDRLRDVLNKKGTSSQHKKALDFHLEVLYNSTDYSVQSDMQEAADLLEGHVFSYGKDPFLDKWLKKMATHPEAGEYFLSEILNKENATNKIAYRKFIASIAEHIPKILNDHAPFYENSFNIFQSKFFKAVATDNNQKNQWFGNTVNKIPAKVFKAITNDPKIRKAYIENKAPSILASFRCKAAMGRLSRVNGE